jgi:hypothetical protein
MLNDNIYIEEQEQNIMETQYRCKYNLVIYEIYNEYLHGPLENNDINVYGSYLVAFKSNCRESNSYYINSSEEFENDSLSEILNNFVLLYNEKYRKLKRYSKYHFYSKHPLIRNYKNIIENVNYIKKEIAECIYLKSGHCVAILKTIWIRIIQRVWKKIFKERQDILKKRMLYSSLYYREVYGKWSYKCNYMPGIYGMLNSLKKYIH